MRSCIHSSRRERRRCSPCPGGQGRRRSCRTTYSGGRRARDLVPGYALHSRRSSSDTTVSLRISRSCNAVSISASPTLRPLILNWESVRPRCSRQPSGIRRSMRQLDRLVRRFGPDCLGPHTQVDHRQWHRPGVYNHLHRSATNQGNGGPQNFMPSHDATKCLL